VKVKVTLLMCSSPGPMFVPSTKLNATWFAAADGTSAMRG